MLQIEKEHKQLVIREIPLRNWGLGVFFLLIGLFILFWSFFEKRPISVAIGSLRSLPFALGFIYFFTKFPLVTIRIDKNTESVPVRKKGLFKTETSINFFREINGPIFVKEIKAFMLPETNQLILPLKTGEQVPLTSALEADEVKYAGVADEISRYIQSSGH